MLAAAKHTRYTKILKELLEQGADINVVNNDGDNIFHVIIECAPSDDEASELMKTVFTYKNGREKDFDKLLNGSQALNGDGLGVVHTATMRQFPKALSLLKENGANLNLQVWELHFSFFYFSKSKTTSQL